MTRKLTHSAHYAHCAPDFPLCSKQCQHFVERPIDQRVTVVHHPQISHPQVFFLKANYIGGDIQLNKKELEDYMWVTKKEMKDYVSEDFYSTISPVLPEH